MTMESESMTGFSDLPVELYVKILSFVDPLDVLSFARVSKTCNKYAENHRLWKHQWKGLSSKTPFRFHSLRHLRDFSVNFKESCFRLWKILAREGPYGGLIPIRCVHCKDYTCSCLEDRNLKITLDIGGKITWLITGDFSLKRHLSMIAVPKLLRCYDCDATLNRKDWSCDCQRCSNLTCRSPRMFGHTALEYCSQPLSEIRFQPRLSQPFCLFCDEEKVNKLLCEGEMVSSTKNKMKGFRPPYLLGGTEEEFLNYSAVSPLTNGYCKDTASILGADNLDLLSPLLALESDVAFPVVRAYLTHIFHQFKLVNDLQRPNSSFILTEPGRLPISVKEHLFKYLFEEVKITRLCLLPKALAVSQLFGVDTCIVIDSGATCTSVCVILEGRVDEERTQTMSVGGWHVSQFLKQALTWKDNKDAVGATVSSLDTSAVKEKCRLSLNLSRESELRAGRFETLHIKSQRDNHKRLEKTEVTLSSELYLAPEMMYASLDLPAMVSEATYNLPCHLIKDCFSHILIAGGNSGLQGFAQRLASDLRGILPEHSPIINVRLIPTGNHSWDTVMGANRVKIPSHHDKFSQLLHEPGTPFWISREEYILFGAHRLTSSHVREG